MSFELGAEGKTDKMFFSGKQDIEDSISNDVWIAFVKEATDEKLILTYQEIQNLKDAIPDNIAGSKEQKFYKMLEKFVKEKLNEKLEEKISWSVLPTKGNELAQLLLNYIDSIDKISPKIKTAFDKLTTKDVICQPNIIEIKE
ncbi:MAG: hypothetical protein Q7J06_06825 [Bacteroidales bacterium]|nr:hypothetical protein [Bacteroidales bacterium]